MPPPSVAGDAPPARRARARAGRFLQGAPSDRCRALVLLGGRLCAGLRARPFFTARAVMALRLQGLALHL